MIIKKFIPDPEPKLPSKSHPDPEPKKSFGIHNTVIYKRLKKTLPGFVLFMDV
jgi:hypothetical protein